MILDWGTSLDYSWQKKKKYIESVMMTGTQICLIQEERVGKNGNEVKISFGAISPLAGL